MTFRQFTYSLAALLVITGTSLAQRLQITTPSANDVSMMTRQAVIVNGRPGTKVVLFVNGAPVDTGAVRPDGVYDFLNIAVKPGPVTFAAVSDDLFPETDTVAIHVAGEPETIEIQSAQKEFIADGRSKVLFDAIVRDKWGVPIPGIYYITLKSDTGSIIADDVDPNQPGIQARIVKGRVRFEMAAPSASVVSTIEANWGMVSVRREVEFTTPIVPLMIVGSADASATMLDASGSMTGRKDQNKIDDGFHSAGRLAFYGRGTVLDKYLLTASFDNERRQRDRLFRDLDPDVLYSLYGDNSRVDYTAQTSNPFFVKLERNRSFLMFGDFMTNFAGNELARYDRTFTGVKGHYETRGTTADGFATLTDRRVVQDEIRGQGISGYYFLGSSNVVTGSERVRIETRDKRHNEVILSRVERSRFGDYEIDYAQGTLFFKQPVPSIDAAGNPVYIIVSYESQSGSATNYVAGAQGEQEIVKGWKVGATAVTEERMPTNYTLLGFNTSYRLGDKLKTSAEIAHGSDVANSGAAWKVELGGSPIERMMLTSYFRRVEAGFVNQTAGAGGAAEIGSTKYGAGGTYDGLFSTKITGEFYRQEQNGGKASTTINSITGGLERKIASFANVSLRAENLQYENRRLDTALTEKKGSTLITAKTTVRATEKINITGEYEQSISSSVAEQVKPSSAAIGMEYRMFANMAATVQQRFYIGAGNTTVFGLASDVGYGTSLTGRYEIGNGISGARNQASIGLKNTTKITEDWTANLSLERTRALDRTVAEAKTSDNDAVSLGLEFLPKAAYKAAVKAEFAHNTQAIRRSITFGGDMRLDRDFTVIDKLTIFEEERTASVNAAQSFQDATLSASQPGTMLGGGLMKRFDNAIGLAFRPTNYDWFNAIGKYEKKMEFNGIVMPQSSSNVDIVSLHLFVEPVERLEIGMKFALKSASEEAYGLTASTFTDFALLRAEYDLNWNHFDVGAEYRILSSRIVGQTGSASSKQGMSAEIGNVVFENIRIAAGYNFVGMTDKDLLGREYRSAGPFLSVRAKFTEKLLNMFNQ